MKQIHAPFRNVFLHGFRGPLVLILGAKNPRFASHLDSQRCKRDECNERKRNDKKCKHRKVLLKTQLAVRNVNREGFKAGNNCFKLSIIGLYFMSWTRAWTNTAILGASCRTEKTTGLIVDKLFRF